jgi:hypothetical protein
MSDVSSTLHQSEIPCSKGEILFKGISKASGRDKTFSRGSNPKESASRGSSPKRRMTLFH